MKRLALCAAILALAAVPARAASFYFSPDVPTDLGGTRYFPWDVVRDDGGVYSLVFSLPLGTSIDALFRMNSGDWLLSLRTQAVLGNLPFDPRDVIRFDGAAFSLFFGGAAAGVPASSNVDGAFLVGGDGGALVLGFDAPTLLGNNLYEPADLVQYSGGAFSPFFDASATAPPIPASTGVMAAARLGTWTILAFDVPTTLGALTFLPGQLAAWDGAAFSTFSSNAAWPLGSRIAALAIVPAPGEALDLRVTPVSAATIRLAWTAACGVGAEDYAIYEGAIGAWYSHAAIDCHDDGAPLEEDVPAGPGGRYYLVVATNPGSEGSYGRRSGGAERPVGAAACAAPQVIAACP